MQSKVRFLSLLSSAAIFSVSPGYAQEGPASTPVSAMIQEENFYYLRFGTVLADGRTVQSSSVDGRFARRRNGDSSRVYIDVMNGATMREYADATSVAAIIDTVPVEAVFDYDYNQQRLGGPSGTGSFFNAFVRPKLNQGPVNGADGRWAIPVSLADLGLSALTGGTATIALTRQNIASGGRPYVLIEFEILAFVYREPSGNSVILWGKGLALSDPGFGEIYTMGANFRAVSDDGALSPRPLSEPFPYPLFAFRFSLLPVQVAITLSPASGVQAASAGAGDRRAIARIADEVAASSAA